MSHVHFCDVAGHLWECHGRAVRLDAGDIEPPVCICSPCQRPMEEGDHSQCALELVPCPEHLQHEQVTQINEDDGVHLILSPISESNLEAALEQLGTYEAACLWCGGGYTEFNYKAEDEHFAYYCPNAPEELRANAKRRLLQRDNDNDDDGLAPKTEGENGAKKKQRCRH